MVQLLAVALKFGFKSVDTAVEMLYSGIHSLLLFNCLLLCKHNIIFQNMQGYIKLYIFKYHDI
nr:MAG TPA: hypothetical protein [Caudoviricetes sp.]